MRILWFANTPCGSARRKGGASGGGWLVALETAIKSIDGIELHVAFLSNDISDSFEYEGVTYHPIHNQNKSVYGGKIGQVLSRFKKIAKTDIQIRPLLLDIIERVTPDLIHIHGTEHNWGIIADTVKNLPIVYSIQGLIAPYTVKYWSGVPMTDIKKHETFSRWIRHITFIQDYNSFLYRAEREKMFLEKAKYILGRTFWDRRCTLLLNPNRKYFQAEEILRDEFYKKAWLPQPANGKFRIVSTISGSTYKGFETALHAAKLLKQYARFDFEWTIIGYDEKNQMVKVSEDFKQMKSADCNICFAGRVDADAMVKTLLSSNVYCHVSHIENSPNSVCEALLMGLPTIASYAGGTATLTKGDESEALLYQDGDPYILAGSIVDVHDNYNLYIEKAKNARISALYRHDPKRVGKSYIQIYDEIITDFATHEK